MPANDALTAANGTPHPNGSAVHEPPKDAGGTPIGAWDSLWSLVHDACGWNPVCGSVMTFRGRMTKDKLVTAFEHRQRRFPKFGQRLANLYQPFSMPTWEDAPRFQPEDHVEVVRLSGAADRKYLEKLMGHLLARDWDYTRPLWQCLLIENYYDDEGAESALLTRWHHTLADGQGYFLAELFITNHCEELVNSMNKGASKQRALQTRPFRPSRISRRLRPLDGLLEVPLLKYPFYFFFLCLYVLVSLPGIIIKSWTTAHALVHTGTLFLLMWWRLDYLAPPQPPGLRVRGREYASSRRVPISDIKTVQKAFGRLDIAQRGGATGPENPYHVTINHVFVSVATEVFTDLLHERKEGRSAFLRWTDRFLPSRIALFIPMSTRKPGDWTTGNLVTGVVTQFPSAPGDLYKDARRRSVEMMHRHLHQTKAELELLKHSWMPKILEKAVAFIAVRPILFPPFRINMLPVPILHEYTAWATRRAMSSLHAILTNVPIQAKETVKLEGIEVIRWTALPPQGEKGTLALGVVSYAGNVTISVGSDKVPGKEGFARMVCERFEQRFAVWLDEAKSIIARDA